MLIVITVSLIYGTGFMLKLSVFCYFVQVGQLGFPHGGNSGWPF